MQSTCRLTPSNDTFCIRWSRTYRNYTPQRYVLLLTPQTWPAPQPKRALLHWLVTNKCHAVLGWNKFDQRIAGYLPGIVGNNHLFVVGIGA